MGVPHTGDILFKTQLLLCLLSPTPGKHPTIYICIIFFYCVCIRGMCLVCSIDAFVFIYLQQQLMLTSVTDYFIGNRFFVVVFYLFFLPVLK